LRNPLGWAFVPALGLLLASAPVAAHPIDEVQGEARLELNSGDHGRTFTLAITLARSHLEAYRQALLEAGLPPEQDTAALHATVGRAFAFAPCAVASSPQPAVEMGPQRAVMRYQLACPVTDTLELTRVGYRQAKTRTTLYVTLQMDQRPPVQLLLPPRLASLTIDLRAGTGTAGEQVRANWPADTHAGAQPTEVGTSHLPPPGSVAPWWQPPPGKLLRAWTTEGLWHLALGWDHLLFLLTLVLVAARLRDLVWAVTAFSLGHLTAMATALWLGLLDPPWWDVLIGLTIAQSAWRARLTTTRTAWQQAWPAAVFGLVHGLGFGGGLQALTVGVDRLAWPLAAFGLGLDLAQVLWVPLTWLAWRRLDRTRWQVPVAWALLVAGLVAAGLAAVP
jgi:hypothetical protein